MDFMPIFQKYLQWRDRRFPMGNILRHTQYVLVFKTTNYCWYQCSHCCESSGRKISAKWQKSDGDKSLARVRADLVRATWREETRARLLEGWRFNER